MLFLPYDPNLSSSEFKIYKYVLRNAEQVIYMRVRDLATITDVSTTSIMRFCQKFECEGFSDFKVKLKLFLQENKKMLTLNTLNESALSNFLIRAERPEFVGKMKAAIELLKEVELLLFVSQGREDIAARYGVAYFSQVYQLVFRVEDFENYKAKSRNDFHPQQTCAIVLSDQGENKTLIDTINTFLKWGIAVLSITNTENSTIARLSDANLAYYTSSGKGGSEEPFSQLPMMYILEQLAKEAGKTVEIRK